MRSSVRLGIVVAVLALAGCSQNLVQVRESATGEGEALALKRVAVAPFRAVPRPGAPVLRSDATSLIGSYLTEGLSARGLYVVPPSDVAQALGSDEAGPDLRSALALAASQFGADALVTGTVTKFRDRSGEAMGSLTPASVGFDVKIYAAPGGKLLWAGTFDHTQVALGENALTATQYPGGGTRWLTSEELASPRGCRSSAERKSRAAELMAPAETTTTSAEKASLVPFCWTWTALISRPEALVSRRDTKALVQRVTFGYSRDGVTQVVWASDLAFTRQG